MNVLIVGCGSIGRTHINNLNLLKKIKKIFILTRINNCLNLFDNAKGKIEAIKAIDNLRIDFAIICNDTSEHFSSSCLLAKRGINLFIEKPVFDTLEKAREFGRIIAKKKIKLFVGYNLRFLGAINYLKKQIQNKIVGDLYFARIEAGQYLPLWRKNIDYRHSYSARHNRGGGVSLDLSHEIDYMRYLFGDPSSWRVFKAKVSHLDIDCEDIFEGVYLYRNNFMCSVHLDYLEPEKKRSIRLLGSKGEIFCDLIGQKIEFKRAKKLSTVTKKKFFNIDATYKEELKHYIRLVEGKEKTKVNLEDGIRALELIEDSPNV